MKKLFIFFTIIMGLSLKAQPPCSFTVNPTPGPYSITCTSTNVLLSVAPPSNTYTWTSFANPPVNGTSATFTSIGVYTISASNGTNCTSTSQTFAVVFNTVAPTTSVNPNSQAINCTNSVAVTFSGTCTNPTVNMQHDWYSPLAPLPAGPPIATTNNTITILAGAIPPGVYTLQTTNLVTGCMAYKTVTVTSLLAFPTFSVSSTTGFSVGCVPLNSTTISINGAASTQTPPGICTFSFLPPGFGGTLSAGTLGNNTSTSTTLPGTWTVIVHDNSNSCRSILTVPIVQNTVGPHVLATMALGQTLTCTNPTLLATGSSTTGNTIISWNIPQNPPNLSTPTCVVGPVTGPNTSTTSLTYASYTVISQNTLTACQTTSVVQIYQNFKPPISSPTISIATPTAIYCNAATNPAILTTGNSTTTSGGGPTAFVANPCWAGPSPQTPTCGTSYTAYVAGIYTLVVQDNYNGCYGSGTINVLDRTQPPIITNSVNTAIMDCNTEQAALSFALTGTMTGGVKYWITSYPVGTAFTPTDAIKINANPDLNGTVSNSVTVSKIGQYIYIVTNTLTGCKATGTITVNGSDLQALMEPSPESGFAPLNVTFFNNSRTSINSLSITSVWNFGNGEVKTNTTVAQVNTNYSVPGNYTVMLIAIKGSCIDTIYKTIKVEIPSKLEVPNVFTPNGDGSNDLFFMKVAGLTEVTAIIFDRWGNKVYDVVSKTGNISWDGKTLAGVDCPSGVYFYVIKATGKDLKEYEQKGNVSIFR